MDEGHSKVFGRSFQEFVIVQQDNADPPCYVKPSTYFRIIYIAFSCFTSYYTARWLKLTQGFQNDDDLMTEKFKEASISLKT